MSNSTQTRHKIIGTADFKSNGLIYLSYTEPTPDTKCASNESCPKNPSYASKCLSICVKFHNVIQWKVTFSLLCVTNERKKSTKFKILFKILFHSWNGVLTSWLHPKQRIDGEMSRELYRTAHKAFIHEYLIATNMKGTPKHVRDFSVPETLCPSSWRIKWIGVKH
jgi:hypothetical protein